MKAIEITAFGAPDVLSQCERAMPVPGIGELLIRVAASGVNRPDVLQRTGHYPVPPGASDIPGLEVAGTIEQGDEEALVRSGFKLGDHVCALVAGGALVGWGAAVGAATGAGAHCVTNKVTTVKATASTIVFLCAMFFLLS